MANKKSIGRKASDQARAAAQALVNEYWPAVHSPDGHFCVNAGAESHEHTFGTKQRAAENLLAAIIELCESGWLPVMGVSGKLPIGRKASDEARREAKNLAQTYGPAVKSPDGSYCVNPEDGPEDHIYVSAEKAAYVLLEAMQRLAATGWLEETEVKLERFLIREQYKHIRGKTHTTKEAIEKLGMEYPRSQRDLERQVGKTKR